MADSKAKDAVAKQRIIAHMNKDHQDSLVRYLEHYTQLSSFAARHAYLSDITFDNLIVSANKSSYTIPIRPPMSSWSDARPRVVAMDAEAVAGLKRSNITVKKYVAPNASQLVGWVIFVLAFALFIGKENLMPGSYIYENVWRYAPNFGRWCSKIQPFLRIILIIHPIEAVYMGFIRSRKHSVPMFGALWWKWTLSVLVGGFPEFSRFNQLVRDEERAKSIVKH